MKHSKKADRIGGGQLNNMAKKGSGQTYDYYGEEYYCEEDDAEELDQSQIAYQETFSAKNKKAGNKKNDANHLLGFFTEEAQTTPKLPPGPKYKSSKPQMAILSKD